MEEAMTDNAIRISDDMIFVMMASNVNGVIGDPAYQTILKLSPENLDALAIVDACLRLVVVTKPVWWALENPVGKLTRYLGKAPLYFQPWMYGDPYSKLTGIWGEYNEPAKTPVENTEGSKMWSNYGGKSERTKTARSMTPQGFARAFFKANP